MNAPCYGTSLADAASRGADEDERDCIGCGREIVLTGEAYAEYDEDGAHRAFEVDDVQPGLALLDDGWCEAACLCACGEAPKRDGGACGECAAGAMGVAA